MTATGDLLQEVLEAHGGADAWRAAQEIRARARSGGLALASRLQPRAFRGYEARVALGEPRVVISPYPSAGCRGVFLGDTVRIESEGGARLAERVGARAALRSLRRHLWWDHLDALYFAGYALWNYFTTPLLLLRPWVETREIDGWEETGERWRRLHVTFPREVPTHSREQVFYFDARGLLRRLDYTAEVFGGWAKAAHYCWDHRPFGGLVLPTRRRVLPRKADGAPRRWPTLVWIEVDAATVA